jgi:excisionase family DNA binding protein
MTVTEAAAALGLKPVTVRRHIARGLIVAVKAGRDWSIERREVERYKQERRGAGRPKR